MPRYPDFGGDVLAAVSAERRHNLDAAFEWAKRAIALKPNYAEFEDTLGSVHLARGEVMPAIAAFRKAASSKPPQAEFYYNLGRALMQQGDRVAAMETFKNALSVEPNFAHSAEARKHIEQLAHK